MPLQSQLSSIRGHEACLIAQERLDCIYAVLLGSVPVCLQECYCWLPAECSELHVFCIGEGYVQNIAHQRPVCHCSTYT